MPLFSFRSVDNIDIYENSLHTRGENTKHEEKFLRKHICVYIYMRVYIYICIYIYAAGAIEIIAILYKQHGIRLKLKELSKRTSKCLGRHWIRHKMTWYRCVKCSRTFKKKQFRTSHQQNLIIQEIFFSRKA